jgi:peptidoglycan-N-acetylglucosamine deacetylase
MSKRAYLTIDDSPMKQTDQLADWLIEKDIPAIFFVIGSSYSDVDIHFTGMDQNPDPIRRLIEKDFVVGNHTFTHRRSSEMTFEEVVEEIEKTEMIIERLYREAGKSRIHKLIRFPHLDRGCGANIIDYDAALAMGYDLKDMFLDGLNIRLVEPTTEQIEKKAKIQDYLAREGFSTEAFKDVTFDWYHKTEMADSRDLLYTYSTADWMMNPDFSPHRHKWPYQSLEALKKKIDDDLHMQAENSVNIVLAHDKNNMFEVTTSLIDHMKNSGIEFLPIKS